MLALAGNSACRTKKKLAKRDELASMVGWCRLAGSSEAQQSGKNPIMGYGKLRRSAEGAPASGGGNLGLGYRFFVTPHCPREQCVLAGGPGTTCSRKAIVLDHSTPKNTEGGPGTGDVREAIVLDHSTPKNTKGAPGSGVGNLGLGVRIVSFYSVVSTASNAFCPWQKAQLLQGHSLG